MELTILTPEEAFFKGNISSVKVPGISGGFEILSNHAPIVSALGRGNVSFTKEDGSRVTIQIGGGFVEVLNNKVAVLAQDLSQEA